MINANQFIFCYFHQKLAFSVLQRYQNINMKTRRQKSSIEPKIQNQKINMRAKRQKQQIEQKAQNQNINVRTRRQKEQIQQKIQNQNINVRTRRQKEQIEQKVQNNNTKQMQRKSKSKEKNTQIKEPIKLRSKSQKQMLKEDLKPIQNLEQGVVTFKKNITKHLVQRVKNNGSRCLIHQNGWRLGRGLYNSWKAPDLLNIIDQCRIEVFKVYTNNRTNFLKEIQNVRFPNLQLLNIYGNRIFSLEGIENIWLPNLKIFYFGNNCIINIRPLRKMFIPSLECLGFQLNFINDLEPLNELDVPQLNSLEVEMNPVKDKVQGGQNLAWLAKFPSTNIISLLFESVDRFKRDSFYKKLNKKFQFLTWDQQQSENDEPGNRPRFF